MISHLIRSAVCRKICPKASDSFWQGSPRWQDLAWHAFHVRKVIVYFALLTLLQGVMAIGLGETLADAVRPAFWLLPMGALASLILLAIAYWSARTTIYTITSRRVAMRIGMALPLTLNLPFSQIDGAGLRLYATGAGDIPLSLHGKDRLAYLVLWPHARPFRFKKPEPMLRAVPEGEKIAKFLVDAIEGKPVPSLIETRKRVRFFAGCCNGVGDPTWRIHLSFISQKSRFTRPLRLCSQHLRSQHSGAG